MLSTMKYHLQNVTFKKSLPWIILFVATVNVVMIGGKRRSFGLFVTALNKEFPNVSYTELNWIGDTYTAFGFFMMPIVSTYVMSYDRAYRKAMLSAGCLVALSCILSSISPSPGYLFFTHTVLHGLASSIILSTVALVTGEYFDKHHKFHVLATALVSGGPYGAMIFGPMYATLIDDYGWRKAFQIVAIPFLICTVAASIFFIPRHYEYEDLDEEKIATKKKKSWAFCSWEHFINNKQIALWFFDRLLHNAVMYGMLMNLATFVTNHLGGKGETSYTLSLTMGIGESFIFTMGAVLGDRMRGYLPMFQLFGAFAATIVLFAMIFCLANLTALSALCFFLGSTMGIGNTALYATTEEIMLLHGSISYPMSKMFAGLGMVASPIFSGLAIEMFEFQVFFNLQVILMALRAVILFVINLTLMHKYQQEILLVAMKQQEMIEKHASQNALVGEDGFPKSEASSPIVHSHPESMQDESRLVF